MVLSTAYAGEPLLGKAWTFCGDPDNGLLSEGSGGGYCWPRQQPHLDFGEVSFLDTLETLEDAQIPMSALTATWRRRVNPSIWKPTVSGSPMSPRPARKYTIYTTGGDGYGARDPLGATITRPFPAVHREGGGECGLRHCPPHWGVEHSTELGDEQIRGAHACIDAGADAVIGAHPHILQGIEYYKGKPIMYSLGNFWFDDYDIDTLVARASYQGEKTE